MAMAAVFASRGSSGKPDQAFCDLDLPHQAWPEVWPYAASLLVEANATSQLVEKSSG
ncbi:MAG: hypothetical protein Q7R60_02900 [bacterium]|nr:hypothetical protein [bacterium]